MKSGDEMSGIQKVRGTEGPVARRPEENDREGKNAKLRIHEILV
jgi:hypothetical protein